MNEQIDHRQLPEDLPTPEVTEPKDSGFCYADSAE
jgi:hypothetical protein